MKTLWIGLSVNGYYPPGPIENIWSVFLNLLTSYTLQTLGPCGRCLWCPLRPRIHIFGVSTQHHLIGCVPSKYQNVNFLKNSPPCSTQHCSTFWAGKNQGPCQLSWLVVCGPLRNPSCNSRPSSGRKGVQTNKRESWIVKGGFSDINPHPASVHQHKSDIANPASRILTLYDILNHRNHILSESIWPKTMFESTWRANTQIQIHK